jgi:hypothetical protein
MTDDVERVALALYEMDNPGVNVVGMRWADPTVDTKFPLLRLHYRDLATAAIAAIQGSYFPPGWEIWTGVQWTPLNSMNAHIRRTPLPVSQQKGAND